MLSSHLVESSFLTYCLVVPLLVYSSTLRASVEMLLDKLNDRLHEDMDYISTLARRHSLSSSTGSTAAILDCLVVVPRSLRSQEQHEIVARRVERRHDELKGNTTS